MGFQARDDAGHAGFLVGFVPARPGVGSTGVRLPAARGAVAAGYSGDALGVGLFPADVPGGMDAGAPFVVG
ncbi:hypothetical protein [Streptomyces sp. NPDC014006]|uniref:hypothetical protein n=1 Tax=Streptomyces sp. NPDC014006 TaxID=3364870 RepID=UPI0036FC6FC8